MIDIHVHVLPGVDDGPESVEEAVRMCRQAARDGVSIVVATPHQRHEQWSNQNRQELQSLWRDVQAAVGAVPRVLLGAEIAMDSDLLSEVDRLPDGNLLPLADSRYLLLEPHPLQIGPDATGLVHELILSGWVPILAHPERIDWLAENPRLLADLAGAGALFQLTAMSVTGGWGHRLQTRCRTFLDGGFAHFVASDMHHALNRPAGLAEAYAEIAEGWGEDVARRLLLENPQAVIENRALSASAGVAGVAFRAASE